MEAKMMEAIKRDVEIANELGQKISSSEWDQVDEVLDKAGPNKSQLLKALEQIFGNLKGEWNHLRQQLAESAAQRVSAAQVEDNAVGTQPNKSSLKMSGGGSAAPASAAAAAQELDVVDRELRALLERRGRLTSHLERLVRSEVLAKSDAGELTRFHKSVQQFDGVYGMAYEQRLEMRERQAVMDVELEHRLKGEALRRLDICQAQEVPVYDHRLRVCYDEAACSGTVWLTMNDHEKCKQWLGQTLSNHSETETLLHSLGPVYWDVLISGPEMAGPWNYHLGDCRYAATFSLRTPGNYSATVTARFAGYNAIDEHRFQNACPLEVGPNTRHKLTLTCRASHRPQAGKPPVCKSFLHGGRYIQGELMPYSQRMTPGTGWPIMNPSVAGDYPGLRFLEDEPCLAKMFDQQQTRQLLAGKRVLFIGDSHTRSVFGALKNKMENRSNKIEKFFEDFQAMMGKYTTLGYTLSYFARADYMDLLGRWNFIVWGYGHWALAKTKHWSVKAFIMDLQQKIDAMKAAQAEYPDTVVVFVTLPAVQLEESFGKPYAALGNRFRIKWADFHNEIHWNNNQHVYVLNQLAVRMMRDAGLLAVDHFSRTYSMLDKGLTHSSHWVKHPENPVLRQVLDSILTMYAVATNNLDPQPPHPQPRVGMKYRLA